jgi:hypothetical protein
MAKWEGTFDLPEDDTPVADALAGSHLKVPAVTQPGA